MKPVPKAKPIFEPGPGILWREDIRELLNLVAARGAGPVRIASGEFEFESLEELFENSSPKINLLFLNWEEPQVHIKFSRKHSICTMGASHPDPLLYQQLRDFFRRRRSVFSYLTPLRLIAFSCVLAAYIYAVMWNAQRNALQGLQTALLLLPIFWIFFAAWGGPKRTVRIRNQARHSAELRHQERIERYFELAGAAVLGGILTVIVQHFKIMLGW